MRNPNRLNQVERKKINKVLEALNSIRQPVETDEAIDYTYSASVSVSNLLVCPEIPLTDEIDEALEVLEDAHSVYFDMQAEAEHAVKVLSDAMDELNIMLERRQK